MFAPPVPFALKAASTCNFSPPLVSNLSMHSNMTGEGQKISLRKAALAAGLGYLLTPTAFAEFYAYPHLVVMGNMQQTTHNIQAHPGLFFAAFLCYLGSYVCDIVIAWGLYFLLKPVSPSLSLLAAWFQLVYAAVGLYSSLNLVTVLRLLNRPEYLALLGPAALQAQVGLLLASFRASWEMSLVFFAIHLGLVGYLVYRSGYVPKLLGLLLAVAGMGYLINSMAPYMFPKANLGWLPFSFSGELFFMFWLLIKGTRLGDQTTESSKVTP